MTDVETSTPLLVEDSLSSSSDKFGNGLRYSLAAGSLLCMGAIALLAYDSIIDGNIITSTTNLAIWDNHDDIAFCQNNFIYGVTPRTAARGCVVISRDDLFDPIAEDSLSMPAAHLCVGSSDKDGLLKVDFDMIKKMGDGMFYDDTTDFHSISGISPGKDVDVQIFSGKNFNGKSAIIQMNEDGRLPTKFYEDGTSANDNVNSFIVMSSADHFFAGKSCGLHQQVCTGVLTANQAQKEPPVGCAVITSRDPVPLRGSAETKYARICTDRESNELPIDNKALIAMDMIHRGGDKKSLISYISKGDKVNLKYYSSKQPGEGESAIGTKQLEHKKYGDRRKVNDNVYSMIFSSDASTVPEDCSM